jgi:glycosyltransferase involved in cell wall biosynthesis
VQPVADPTEPTLAVVVATHGRAHLLPRLVAALESQRDAPPFELVIVDDGSPDDTWAILTHLSRRSSINLRPIRLLRNRGPATARNIGWRSSSADFIAFTDDDCSPEPDWLAAIADGLRSAGLVQGRTVPDPEQLEHTGPFSRTLSIDCEDGFYQTCNVGYRRELLERSGGFEEAFRFPAGEDTDLAWRVKADGAMTAFRADAVVRHDVRPSDLLVAIRDSWRWQSVALAISRHPELRNLLPSKYVWRHAHQYAALALGGLGLVAAVPRSRAARLAALALAAPYVNYRAVKAPLPTAGPRRRWALLPAAFAVDTAEVVACLVGSARHRTFVL